MIVRPLLLPDWINRWLVVLSALWVCALYFITRGLHVRWRAFDIEYAKRLQSSGSRNLFGSINLQKRFTPDVAVQLARDLQLTLRAFSSAVYVALFIFALALAVLVTVLTTDWLPVVTTMPTWLDATWLPAVMATKIMCVLATASSSILVAVLVAYQLPHFWLERASGVSGRRMWENKLWYARIVSITSPLAVWLIAVVSGTIPLFYAVPLLLECIWLWWIVSTLIGALAFEMPDRPELAIILMISFGAMFGLFVSIFWPIGIVLFALNGIRGLTTRGHARANFCLQTEGD